MDISTTPVAWIAMVSATSDRPQAQIMLSDANLLLLQRGAITVAPHVAFAGG